MPLSASASARRTKEQSSNSWEVMVTVAPLVIILALGMILNYLKERDKVASKTATEVPMVLKEILGELQKLREATEAQTRIK